MDDLLRRLWRRFGRPTISEISVRVTDVDAFDQRLTSLEQEQREIGARLRLLEQQADPRGKRQHG